MSLENELVFHSRAKTNDAKYLSTMQITPNPLNYKGNLFVSMEHAYHSEKFNSKYSSTITPGHLSELQKHLQVTGNISDPKEAKRFGGKGNFRKLKVTLDTNKFNPNRYKIMMDIALARVSADPRFEHILQSSSKNGVHLKHYERGRADKVFWGGNQNTLGKIYMEIGNMLNQKQSDDEPHNCALHSETGRCRKSKQGDSRCYTGPKKWCRLVKTKPKHNTKSKRKTTSKHKTTSKRNTTSGVKPVLHTINP